MCEICGIYNFGTEAPAERAALLLSYPSNIIAMVPLHGRLANHHR